MLHQKSFSRFRIFILHLIVWKEIAEFMNDVQEIFDAADEWERKIHDLMLEHAGMDRLLQVTSEFLQNPMTVTGLDFTFRGGSGKRVYLPPRARLYTDDGLNMEYVKCTFCRMRLIEIWQIRMNM